MGFLRRLFGSGSKSGKDNSKRRRWSFVKNTIRTNKSLTPPPLQPLTQFDSTTSLDANKHAIAVAAATAAVAEAALAAAHAAAEVVRLTRGSVAGSSTTSRPVAAAVKIQSAFRGYLARRALRALKALVKLQALVRGHIVRKHAADMLRRMQTLVRLQAQARASRSHFSDNNMRSFKSSLSHYPVPEEYERPLHAYGAKLDGSSMLKRCNSNANSRDIDSERARFGSKWFNRWMEDNVCSQTGDAPLRNGHPDDEKSDKILEVDTWKPRFISHHSSSSFQTAHCYMSSDYNNNNNDNYMAYESPSKRSTKALNQNLSSREALSLNSLKFHRGKEEVVASRTADNSPQALSASYRTGTGARRGPFTPTRSECSWGYFSGYSGYPNYMANTESSRAKLRSQSAPKQRLEFERYGSTRRHIQSLWDVGPNSDRDSDTRSNVLPSSSRLNRIGSNNLR